MKRFVPIPLTQEFYGRFREAVLNVCLRVVYGLQCLIDPLPVFPESRVIRDVGQGKGIFAEGLTQVVGVVVQERGQILFAIVRTFVRTKL